MNHTTSRPERPRSFEVVRKRRAFGLDAPRPVDLQRREAEIRRWLETHLPSGLVLRLVPEAGSGLEAAPTLLLLLSGCRVLVLRLAGSTVGPCGTPGLASHCRTKGIPIALVSGVDDVRTALRRLGIEPEET